MINIEQLAFTDCEFLVRVCLLTRVFANHSIQNTNKKCLLSVPDRSLFGGNAILCLKQFIIALVGKPLICIVIRDTVSR